jgi:hypothetical protein
VRQALERLLEFSKADFPPAAATDIEKLVRVRDPHSEALLLAGLLDVRGVIKDLKPLAKNEEGRSPFSNNAWSANLALARLGDAGAVKHCVEAIAAEADLSQRVRHFPELAYIRQEAATRELVRHLMSEERLPGVKPGDPGGKIAVNALHALAESIEGFPIMTDRHGEYTEEQITTARKWVREQKELELKW